ncbi:MAG TPA: HPF/RaiA family ribosome-associated protein [Acidimicrobiia bacterium]
MSDRATPATTELDFPTQLITDGDVLDADVDYVWHRLLPVVQKLDEPVHLVRVKLGLAEVGRPLRATAQVLVDIHGDLVRAHVAAETMSEAIDQLKDRLVDQLDHRAERRKARRHRADSSEPGRWRHGDRTVPRPAFYDRPPEEREIVRRKTYALDPITPDEAIFDMEQLDHDFYLFQDVTNDSDALVARQDDGTYLLMRIGDGNADPGPSAFDIVVSGARPSRLTPHEAIEQLETLGLRYLLFEDAESGRGAVVYRRYDGHYGLITAE